MHFMFSLFVFLVAKMTDLGESVALPDSQAYACINILEIQNAHL